MSIEQLGDDYFKVYVWGHRQPNGKRKHYSRRVHGGIRTAQQVERKLYALRNEEALALTSEQTVAQYAGVFIAEKKRTGAAPGTITHYENSLTGKLVPIIGETKMCDVDSTLLRQTFADIEHQTKRKKPLGGTTRHRIEADIKAMFTQAANDRLIPHDPGRGVVKTAKDSAERMALSREDAAAFLAHVQGYAVELPATLMYCTGIRPQEMLALALDDCGLEDSEPWIHICRTVVMRDGKPAIGKVKTRRSDRVLRIDSGLAARLLEHVEAMLEAGAKLGPHWQWEGTLFPATRPTRDLLIAGGLWTPNAFGHAWRRAREPHVRKGRPQDWGHVMPYTMRHTYATQRLREYPLEVVSRLLGHSSSAVTLAHYSHVLSGEMEAVVVEPPR